MICIQAGDAWDVETRVRNPYAPKRVCSICLQRKPFVACQQRNPCVHVCVMDGLSHMHHEESHIHLSQMHSEAKP